VAAPVVTFGNASDVGRVRERNEDYYGVFEPDPDGAGRDRGRLFVVADGMGGHDDGDVASRLAVETLRDTYYSLPDATPVAEALALAVAAANEAVYREGQRDGGAPRRLGTTVTALALRDDRAHVAHVGDSRAYLIRGRAIRQLTDDHSRVAELVHKGVISAAEAEDHPDSHVILRAVGIAPRVEPDVSGEVRLGAGDLVVLCTDGLTRLVRPSEIRAICRAEEPQQACTRLVALANDRGGPDNVTVQVLRVGRARRARRLGTAATVLAVAGLIGAAVQWSLAHRAGRDSALAAIRTREMARSPLAVDTGAAAGLPRVVGRASDARALAVSRQGAVVGLGAATAFLARPAAGGEGDGTGPLATVEAGPDLRWTQILFGAADQIYGVLEERPPGAAARLVSVQAGARVEARPLMRLVSRQAMAEARGLLSRLPFRRDRDVPSVAVDRPADASVTIAQDGVVYVALSDRLLRVEGEAVAVLTERGFLPAPALRYPPRPVAAVAPAADGTLTVVRVDGADVVVETVRGDEVTSLVRLPGEGRTVPRAVARLSPTRVALLLGDRVRVAERTDADVRVVDLIPPSAPGSASGGPAGSFLVLYRGGQRTFARVLEAGEPWTLRPPPAAGPPAADGPRRPAALSHDGAWWVFVVDGAIYRVHLAEPVNEAMKGWGGVKKASGPRT
jgi:protein phosphatase